MDQFCDAVTVLIQSAPSATPLDRGTSLLQATGGAHGIKKQQKK